MATAILDLEFEHLPPGITGLERYHQALLLIRFRGQPVGQTTVPVFNGCISAVDLRHAVVQTGGWPLWEAWLFDRLEWDRIQLAHHPLPSSTVAVCTRDRPDDVRRCLHALMRLHDDGQELLNARKARTRVHLPRIPGLPRLPRLPCIALGYFMMIIRLEAR